MSFKKWFRCDLVYRVQFFSLGSFAFFLDLSGFL